MPAAHLVTHQDHSLIRDTIIRRPADPLRTLTGTSVFVDIIVCVVIRRASVYTAYILATVFVRVVSMSRAPVSGLPIGLIYFCFQHFV